MSKLGNFIREAMIAQGLTFIELGRLIGIPSYKIVNIVYGSSKKISVLQKISAALKIDLSDHIYEIYGGVDTTLYAEVTNIVISILKSNHLLCKQRQLNDLISSLYDFLKMRPDDKCKGIEFVEKRIEEGIQEGLIIVDPRTAASSKEKILEQYTYVPTEHNKAQNDQN